MTPKLTFVQWLKALKNGSHIYSDCHLIFYYDEVEMTKKVQII
jgi:hypothetical protein